VLDVFNFAVAGDPLPFETYRGANRQVNTARDGKKFVLVRGDTLEYRARYVVAFPQPSDTGLDMTDMLSFMDGHKAMSFLVMPYTGPSLRYEIKNIASGASDTVFAFNHRYLDASSVKVYVDDVLQTGGGGDYTFSGNNVAPIVTFGTTPGVSTVRLEANFYVPVVLTKDPMDEGQTLADDPAVTTDNPRSYSFEMVETEPGARFVNATGMSGA
jgi:hypothetical protein